MSRGWWLKRFRPRKRAHTEGEAMEAKDWFSAANSVVSGVCVVLLTVFLLREVRRLRDDAAREDEDDGEAWKRGGRQPY